MPRRWKSALCRLLLITLLFSQWTVAAHACAGIALTAPAAATMEGCDEMPAAPAASSAALCAAHCQQDHQGADRGAAPTLAAALVTSFHPLPALPERSPVAARWEGAPDDAVAASPPHAILHCCFRI